MGCRISLVCSRRSPVCSSPGPGRAGSKLLRITLDLRRSYCPNCGERAGGRVETRDERREGSCCRLALFIVAAAAREGVEARGEGVG